MITVCCTINIDLMARSLFGLTTPQTPSPAECTSRTVHKSAPTGLAHAMAVLTYVRNYKYQIADKTCRSIAACAAAAAIMAAGYRCVCRSHQRHVTRAVTAPIKRFRCRVFDKGNRQPTETCHNSPASQTDTSSGRDSEIAWRYIKLVFVSTCT